MNRQQMIPQDFRDKYALLYKNKDTKVISIKHSGNFILISFQYAFVPRVVL